MDNLLSKSFFGILEKNNLMSLSTTNKKGNSELCSVFYVYDDKFNIYFWSDLESRHAKNLIKNKNVAVNIADSSQKWGSLLCGLQAEGICEKVSLKEIIFPAKLYIGRYPLVKKLISNPMDFFKKYNSSLYKIKLSWIKILDEKTFGKEVWMESFVE